MRICSSLLKTCTFYTESRVGFSCCQDRTYCAILGHPEILYMCPHAPEGAKKAKRESSREAGHEREREEIQIEAEEKERGGSTEVDRRDG